MTYPRERRDRKENIMLEDYAVPGDGTKCSVLTPSPAGEKSLEINTLCGEYRADDYV